MLKYLNEAFLSFFSFQIREVRGRNLFLFQDFVFFYSNKRCRRKEYDLEDYLPCNAPFNPLTHTFTLTHN